MVVVAVALIWRFSFKIIQTEKSPTTAAAAKNKDADAEKDIFRPCPGILRKIYHDSASKLILKARKIFNISLSKVFEDIFKPRKYLPRLC